MENNILKQEEQLNECYSFFGFQTTATSNVCHMIIGIICLISSFTTLFNKQIIILSCLYFLSRIFCYLFFTFCYYIKCKKLNKNNDSDKDYNNFCVETHHLSFLFFIINTFACVGIVSLFLKNII